MRSILSIMQFQSAISYKSQFARSRRWNHVHDMFYSFLRRILISSALLVSKQATGFWRISILHLNLKIAEDIQKYSMFVVFFFFLLFEFFYHKLNEKKLNEKLSRVRRWKIEWMNWEREREREGDSFFCFFRFHSSFSSTMLFLLHDRYTITFNWFTASSTRNICAVTLLHNLYLLFRE